MTSYTDRRRIELVYGTAAVRAALTLAASELWVDVDGGGVPTGDLWLGDGATLGGIGPFRAQGSTDHGSLAGLGDDDHTIYALANGTRAFTGTVTMPGLVNSGASTLGGTVQIPNTGPILLLANTTQEDADGGRESLIIFGGYRSGGEGHYLGQLRVDHEGSGDDEIGRLIVALNDGADVVSPTEVLRVTGDDALALFAGEVRTPFGRIFSARNGARQSFTAGVTATVQFSTTDRLDTGFAWASNELTLSFAGDVDVSFGVSAELTSGTRSAAEWWLEVDVGGVGSWATVPGTYRTTYHRDTTEASSTCMAGKVLTVASGDKLRVRCQPLNSVPIQMHTDGTLFTVKRVQSGS